MTVAGEQHSQLTKKPREGEAHAERAAQQSDDEFYEAWQVFQYWTGTRDAARFRSSYLGRYDDRATFGRELVALLGAYEHLAALPEWLQAYLRVDGDQATADFEAAGDYYLHDVPGGTGIYAFKTHR